MSDDYADIYDYDKSAFFRALTESHKHAPKLEAVQHQGGLIVCPLHLQNVDGSVCTPHTDHALLERHLFVPSPFYKNHYVLHTPPPVASTVDHFTDISLILAESAVSPDDGSQQYDMAVISAARQRICKYVKLLSVQTAYSSSGREYRILVVNKPLQFSKVLQQPGSSLSSAGRNGTEKAPPEKPKRLSQQMRKGSVIPAISLKRNETFGYGSLSDVKSFQQAIDFMQETGVAVSGLLGRRGYNLSSF